MKYVKLFEEFKDKKIDSKVTIENILNCIKRGGIVYATIIKDLPDNDPESALKPLSIDEEGLVTIEFDGNNYEVDLKNINKIDYN